MEIYRVVLMDAIRIAIAEQERTERLRAYTGDSALLATWRELYQALYDKKPIKIKD